MAIIKPMYSCEQCGYSTEHKSNYTRHTRRKTGCGPKTNVQNSVVDVQNSVVDVQNSVVDVRDSVVDVQDSVVDVQNSVQPEFEAIDESNVVCKSCNKEMTKLNITRHKRSCKGVPINTCRCCLKNFKTNHHKNNHKRYCKKNPNNTNHLLDVNLTENNNDTVVHNNQQQIATNIQNNVNNNNITNNVNNNYNITIKFGHEDMKYLESKREIDERVDQAIQCLSDVLDLVYFNADHPENQTLRKTGKKTDLIQTRLERNDWDHEESRVVIPKIKEKLELLMNTKYDMMRSSTFKDVLYEKTSRGPKPEEHILGKYNGPGIRADPEDMGRFLKEVDATCNMYRSACPNKQEFLEQANSVRDFIMSEAETHKISNFNLRNAESMFQTQLGKYD